MGRRSFILKLSRRGVSCLTGHETEQTKCILPLSVVSYPANARRVLTTGSRVSGVRDFNSALGGQTLAVV